MSQFTNEKNVALPLAAWLSHDNYDHNSDPKTISVTTLLKPIKEIALLHTPNLVAIPEDVGNLRASRIGTAVHESIEDVWADPLKRERALTALGYPSKVIDLIRVNPLEYDQNCINIYMEQRGSRSIAGWTVSGKFDFHSEEYFEDFKTTGTYTYQKGNKDQDYIKQLSMYRWLNPNLPSNGMGRIHMLFSDWKPSQSFQEGYPSSDMITKTLALWSPAQTERWITERLQAVDAAIANLHDQAAMPVCSNTETWQDPPEFKYFSKPEAKRATKNFGTDSSGAHAMLQAKGCGLVKTFNSPAKYCNSYCSVREICHQGQSNKTE